MNSDEKLNESNSKNDEVDSEKVGFADKFFWFLDLIKLFLVISVLMQTFCYRAMHVNGDSMVSTLQNNDSIGVSSHAYEPKQGDIVTINTYEKLGRTIIKRVIAVEGQLVDIDNNGEVYVDGVKLNEPYLDKGVKTTKGTALSYPFVVPKNYVFVLGDNRPGSSDSREYGCFTKEQIIGKMMVRFWPFQKFKFF